VLLAAPIGWLSRAVGCVAWIAQAQVLLRLQSCLIPPSLEGTVTLVVSFGEIALQLRVCKTVVCEPLRAECGGVLFLERLCA
jgi:hypothetical protein